MHWAALFTSIGAMLGGLAIVLAFVQLGAQREDKLRTQISKVGAWTGEAARSDRDIGGSVAVRPEWIVSMFIRNGGELPVMIEAADLTAEAWGYNNVMASTGDPDRFLAAEKSTADSKPIFFAPPGTLAPGDTWEGKNLFQSDTTFDQPQPPRLTVTRVVLTDSAGHQWEIRPYRAGPPRRIHWWRRWWRNTLRS